MALTRLVFKVVAHELVVEAIAGTIGDAEHFALVVAHDEVVELGASADHDVLDLLQFSVHRANVTGARTRLDFVGTGNGVAAFKEHVVGHEFATAVDNHLDRVVAAIGDGGKQIGVVDAEAIAQAVFNEEFLAVLDALSLLYRIAGAGNVAPQMAELPPTTLIFSSIRTRRPARPALRAQAMPAKPEPMMTTSNSSS